MTVYRQKSGKAALEDNVGDEPLPSIQDLRPGWGTVRFFGRINQYETHSARNDNFAGDLAFISALVGIDTAVYVSLANLIGYNI